MALNISSSFSSELECPNDDDHNSAETLLFRLGNEGKREYLDEQIANDVELPLWFDEERFKRGTNTFEKNIFIMFAAKMSGLLTLLAIPSIVKVLALTSKSEEPPKAFRRYVDTIRHMLFWYRTRIKDPKSLARESLATVRKHHIRGARLAQGAGHPGISQFDMAMTQFAFCGYVVLRRSTLNLDASREEIQDFLHVWRTLGFLLGISERYNLCQYDNDILRTDELFEGVCQKWLGPALASPPPEFILMSKALIDGVWCMMPVIEYNSYLHFTQELAGVPQCNKCGLPRTYSKIMLAFLHLVPQSLALPFLGPLIRTYHNINMRFSLFMSTYYPILAWYSFPRNSCTQYHKLVASEQ